MADKSKLSVVNCFTCLQGSTLTSHIQQGDVLISVNGVSLFTGNGKDLQPKKAEDVNRIIKLAKSPKKVRLLRLIRSTGDSSSRGANAFDVQLDSHETSLLLESVNKSRIPKFVVSKMPVGKTFDPVSSSLFDVVFSYQPSLGIRIKPFRISCWKEPSLEKSTVKQPLRIEICEPETPPKEVPSTSSDSPSPFSSSSLWKLFECEEELYQSHCYFAGELLKEEISDGVGCSMSTTAESTPAYGAEARYASFEPLIRPTASTSPRLDKKDNSSPRIDRQDPFVLTYPETYAANDIIDNTKNPSAEDVIPPPPKVTDSSFFTNPMLVETPFFTNPMPAAASKMIKLNLRRSSDSGTSCESNLKNAFLSNVIAADVENSLNSTASSPRSQLSLSPVSSLGKSVLTNGRYTPQFPTAPTSPRSLSLGANCLSPFDFGSPTEGSSPVTTNDDAHEMVLDMPNGAPWPRNPLSVRAEIMTPPKSECFSLDNSPERSQFEADLEAARIENEMLKIKLGSARLSMNKGRHALDADLENIKLKLHFTEVELEETKAQLSSKSDFTDALPRTENDIEAERGFLELQKVKDELLILQINFKEQMILNQIEREEMISDLLRAREIAKLLTDDLLNMRAERDRANALSISRRSSSILTDVERMEEIENKIQTLVLPRMVDLDDALSHCSTTAVTVEHVVGGRELAEAQRRKMEIEDAMGSEDSDKSNRQMSVVKQMVAAKERATAENAELAQRNLDYQAAKNRLGLGSLGSPGHKVQPATGMGAGTGTGPAEGGLSVEGSPKSVESPSDATRRLSRGKIRTSLPPGGGHKTERPPWWRVR
jgi:hypothetical protein